MDRFSMITKATLVCLIISGAALINTANSQLIISEIAPNAEIEALEQHGGQEWFEICNVGQSDMDISGYTIGHYEDASFGQSDFYLDGDNCDCGGSYGVITFAGNSQSGDVILPSGECLIITGQDVDCGNSYYCINARDLLLNGPSGIVREYHSSRSDYPGLGNGSGTGALEGHYWRQKNYSCNAYYIWDTNYEIIDAVNFNCLPEAGPNKNIDPMSGGFHYPDGNGGYYSYPPHFPTPPPARLLNTGVEITNSAYLWVGESIEEGFTFQRCSNDPNYVFPPMKYDPVTGSATDNYYLPTCGTLNEDCCSSCDESEFHAGIQLPHCTNGSAMGLIIEENEYMAEQEIFQSAAPSCNNNESRLVSNYNGNEINFCTLIETPSTINKPFVGFVNSLDKTYSTQDCAEFLGAKIYNSDDCSEAPVSASISTNGRPIFQMAANETYTLCFNYDLTDCELKNRVYWDNPCFSPFYCELSVDCPPTIQDTVDCIDLIPIAVTDSIGFVDSLGGEILSTCSTVMISHTDSLSPVNGPKNQKILYREYEITDGMDTIYCSLQYFIINRSPPTFTLVDDTLYLSENGTLILNSDLWIIDSYDVCNDTTLSIDFNPDTLYGDNLGPNDVIVTVTDSASNSSIDTINIIILDNTAPILDCPSDTIINTNACVCETEYVFTDPEFFDENGDTVVITRLDTTGLQSGDLFPSGTTTISYLATDESGNTSSCSYSVTITSADPGAIILKDQINFSLDESCGGYPTPTMIHQGPPACPDSLYEINLFDSNGLFIPEDSLRNYLSEIVTVNLSYLCFDNTAMMDLLIEDKFPPHITCFSDTVSCGEVLQIATPQINDNCDANVEVIILNETLENVSCTDSILSRIIRRTYTSIDENGQRSDTCNQVLSVAKFDLNTVSFLGTDTLIYCGELTANNLDSNGNPIPDITGYPIVDGQSLWPDQDAFCGVTTFYDDIDIPGTSCGRSILRTWNVMYWDCFQDGMRVFYQTINITDNQAPVFTCPDSLTLETEPFSCSAQLNLALPLAVDECDNGVRFDIQYPDGYIESATSINRNLEAGEHDIIIFARDTCDNISSCTFHVSIVDNEDPIAIVNASYSVELSDSVATVTAEVLDNDSFDECGEVTLEIARMDSSCDTTDLDFANDISICCEDVGNVVMVQFLVTDQSGNTSLAMVGVEVFDNVAPILIQDLPDISVSCDYAYIPGNTDIFGTVVLSSGDQDSIIIPADSVVFLGEPTDALVKENCHMVVTEEVFTENLNTMCGLGTITRMLTITDDSGNSFQIDQNITFFNPEPLTTNDINWAPDYYISNVCDPSSLASDQLPVPFNAPIINDDSCDAAAASSLDDIDYGPFISDTLFIINRQWTVADWCQNTNGQFTKFDSTQLIVVTKTNEPEIISGCDTIMACNYNQNCEDIEISLGITAFDECYDPEELIYSFEIDYDMDGSIEVTGSTSDSIVHFPIGSHQVLWTVMDIQGNTTMCLQEITVENCLLPTPICLLNQEFALVGVDTDNNGSIDSEEVTISVEQLDGGTYSPCDAPFVLSFSTDTTVTDTTFDCLDLGTQFLNLYITDIESGYQDFCVTGIEIIDTNNISICDPLSPSMVQITGKITSELLKPTNGVDVVLQGAETSTTTIDGQYAFEPMETGGTYSIIPSYDTYPLDGVSTLDLILIQKHILGIKPLDSPYKLISADVNNSGSISGSDIVAIRKLLLGATTEFPNQPNWHFIPESHEFIDINNPWLNMINEFEIPKLDNDITANYIAIKTADVNNSSPNLTDKISEVRSGIDMQFTALEYEDEWVIPVKIEKQDQLEGFQFSFKFDESKYNFKGFMSGNLSISDGFFSDKNSDLGVVDISWTTYQNNSDFLITDENAFYIILKKKDIFSKDKFNGIDVFSEGLKAEAYHENGEIMGLRFTDKSQITDEIQLFQNKPNPWNNSTNISFYLPQSLNATIEIYDVAGRVIYRTTEYFKGGMNNLEIKRNTLGNAGVYYYSLHTLSSKFTKKMILLE